MDIEDKILEIEKGIMEVKSSQSIGQSNVQRYTIVKNGRLEKNSGSSSGVGGYFRFTSNGRAFPHICIEIISCTVNGVSKTITITPEPMFWFWNNLPDDSTLYKDSFTFSVSGVGSNNTVVIEYNLYADTTGSVVAS